MGESAVLIPPPPAPADARAGVAPLRRLSSEQYRRTVRDLLGLPLDTIPTTALPPDEAIAAKFTSNVVRPLRAEDLDRYAEVAATLAARALASPGNLLPCAIASGDAACARRFIESFGRRAYRRPLSEVEIGRLEKIFAGGGGFANGIRLVLEAFLQSPKFLYLVEPAPADATGKVVGLDGYALASRLSYFLWSSTPDEALLEAAGKGTLNDPAGITAETRRLTADPRFRESAGLFHQAWLELVDLVGAEKAPTVFPAWNAALKTAMAEETRRFVEHVLGEGDGKLATLFNAKWSFLSGPLYDVYGVAKPANAQDWAKVELPAAERAGLLTHPGLMAALSREDRTSFVRRGKMVREALFCQEIPPPPPGVNDSDAEIPPTATARERAAIHRENAQCAACHEAFDPIGFAFESFDAIGRFRSSEGGKPVETRLELTRTSIDGSYANAVELAAKLGTAPDVAACVARQWFRFALGRQESPADEPSLDLATKRLAAGGDVRELLVALVTSPSFRFQAVE